MKWFFITVRSGGRILCNRVNRYGNRQSQGVRKWSSIICGCDWVVKFKLLDHKKYTLSDSVEIVHASGIHSNASDPTFRDQYIVTRTKADECKQFTDFTLQKVVHQISIGQEINYYRKFYHQENLLIDIW